MQNSTILPAKAKATPETAKVHTVNLPKPVDSADSETVTLPIGLLKESKTNPRRRYDLMEQLTESVKLHGVIEPLIVRPDGQGAYEVVAGTRRLRAANGAGLAVVPVRIQRLTDQQVLEFHLIENLQRDDLHALDEALGYHQLAEQAGYTLETIARKVSKSESYVCQRMKLAELSAEVQRAFLARQFTTSHAILIARLQAQDQMRALKRIRDAWRGAMSVRELAEWINCEIHLDLDSAPFSKSDPGLLPAAGACQACPKRAGATPALYPDVKKDDTCTDPSCFNQKLDLHIAAMIRELKAQGKFHKISSESFNRYGGTKRTEGVFYQYEYQEIERDKEACPATTPAIIVQGHNRGQLLKVCASKDCKIHHSRQHKQTPQQIAADRQAQQKAKIQAEVHARILAAVLEHLKIPPQAADLRMVVLGHFRQVWADSRKEVCQRNNIEPVIRKELGNFKDYDRGFARHIEELKEPALYRLLFEMVLLKEQDPSGRKTSALTEIAQRYKVDTKAITNQVAAEFAAKKEHTK